jgi:predicted MFS family arabinose efflux permease
VTSPSDSRTTAPLVAATVTAIAGTAMFNLSPLFLAAAAAEHGIGDRQLGLLMSLEVAGIALASFLTLLLIERLGARRLAVIGGTVILAGNLLAYLATDFATLMTIRFLVGLLGDGLAFAAAIVVLGGSRDPMRAYGGYAFANMCFAGIALALLPQLPGGASWAVMLGLFSLLGIFSLGVSRLLPGSEQVREETTPAGIGSASAWLALAGIFAFTVNLGAVWGFSERLGAAAGLDAEQVGFYLSLAIAFQALGSFTAAALSRFRHRQNLLITVLLTQGCALYLTGSATTGFHFVAGIALWGMSWNFGMAVMLGQLAQRSDGRKLLALVPGTDALGAAAGPAAVSLLTLLPLHWAVVVPAAVGGLLAIALFIRLGRQPRQAPPEPA